MRILFVIISAFFVSFPVAQAQAQAQVQPALWHNKERTLRYHPEGEDIVITNGNRRFTRALYGTHTAFRVEAGDLPEFALYLPGMGGNIKFGLMANGKSKWLINADKITARYRAGSMLYEIEDALLGKGKIHLSILALADKEGAVIKIQTEGNTSSVQLVWAFGGATGKKFNRDGDMGPDPESSFYLKPEYCTDNRYAVYKEHFTLRFGTGEVLSEEDRYENKNLPGDLVTPKKGKEQTLAGIFPIQSTVHVGDAKKQESPASLFASVFSVTPLVTGRLDISTNEPFFFSFVRTDSSQQIQTAGLAKQFEQAELARQKVAGQIKVKTPDPYINTIGGALSIAADAIWESPSYLHGSIGWRMRLNGWRGAYAGDVMGWHDRAKLHFKSYALSQVTTPLSGKIVADTVLHLTRQLEKMGTSLFSSGYISRNPGGDQRPHHYDMNLVFIDELLWHFKWVGDIVFVKEMWPVITRHLDWEKRNFDPDGDGLYDAYAAIWASDALQYSGGSVTHSSAYNYRANKMAAELAVLIGEDPAPFRQEAGKIKKSVDAVLWMKESGRYAEYKDALGLQMRHANPALWTVYHSIDSDLPDAFQSYQLMKYVDENIPHIPIKAKGLPGGFYTISTSNWMPYSWSLNNVALAELMHTSLAGWEAGRNNEAFTLWKSSLLESMYLGGSAGNFQQISTYDAARGEAYRDFADPVGMTARSLIQGLFGILPDALHKHLTIKPGFPAGWNHASIQTPDLVFDFKRTGSKDSYTIIPSFPVKMNLNLLLKANGAGISSITINGKKTGWENVADAIGVPMIRVSAGMEEKYMVSIEWKDEPLPVYSLYKTYPVGSNIKLDLGNAKLLSVSDPQEIIAVTNKNSRMIEWRFSREIKTGTLFLQLQQGDFFYWHPFTFDITKPVEIITSLQQGKNDLYCLVKNNSGQTTRGTLSVGNGNRAFSSVIELKGFASVRVDLPRTALVTGSNKIIFSSEGRQVAGTLINWHLENAGNGLQAVALDTYFNDKVTHIFRNQYLSPRPATVTLQLPVQGIGEWTHPLLTADIDDHGLRKMAAGTNTITLPQGIRFQTPADTLKPNIIFTSQWDNYPRHTVIPLEGKASHAYLLMAGSTNPMQSRMVNGLVVIMYTDGSADTLPLTNPETWWPIEQDYLEDGYAFHTNAPKPPRVHLKTGAVLSPLAPGADPYNGKMINGGAATVLDLVLDPKKTLKELKLQTLSNDVVIGLMSVTLAR